MLLDRTRPNENQSFGDYLEELGKKNGFSDVKAFKLYLANTGRNRYDIGCSYNKMMRLIAGLFIELGVDQSKRSKFNNSLCFNCLTTEPKKWIWELEDESDCENYYCEANFTSRDGSRTERENFCGLMRCSVKRIGLNFSSKKEGLYFADLLSKSEREENGSPQIYPEHKAFTSI